MSQKDRNRRYYLKNREKILASTKKWKQDNPEKAYGYVQARRSRTEAKTVLSTELARIKASQCAHARYGDCEGAIQIDHVVPISRGGKHTIGNLQPLCEKHNYAKYNRLEVEVKKIYG